MLDYNDACDALLGGRVFELGEVPFPRALAAIACRAASGTLALRVGPLHKTLILRAGAPAHVDSNIAEEALDRFLVSRGEIDEAAAYVALTESAASGRDVGEVLVGIGALRPDQLFKALKRSLGARILSAFAWTRGELSFDASEPEAERKILMKINAAPLVVRGVCSYAPIETVRSDLGHPGPFRLRAEARELIPELRLNTVESRVANALAEPRTVEALAEATRVEPDVALRLLYALVLLGIAAPADQIVALPVKPPPEPSARPVSAARRASGAYAVVKSLEPAPVSKRLPQRVTASGSGSAGRVRDASEPTAAPRVESEPAAAPRAESERVAASRAESERVAASRAESERVAASRAESERVRATPRKLTEAEADAIDRAYLTAKSSDYFALLGVDQGVTFDRLKRAFLERSDLLSPMSYRDRDCGSHGERLEETFLLLVRAFSTLATPASRKDYVASLRSGPGASAASRDAPRRNAFAVDEPPNASVVIKTAITFINTGQPAAALEGLRASVREDSSDAMRVALLGYALYLSDPVSRRGEAVRFLQHAMGIDARCLHAFLFLGRISDMEQDRASALGAYQHCLRIDGAYREAREAVDRLSRLMG